MAGNEGGCRVLLHNDDTTPMEFVVVVLCEVFGHGEREAARLMMQVHSRGVAEVARLPREEAFERVHEVHTRAARAGFPLTASISPAPPTEQGTRVDGTVDLRGLSPAQVALLAALADEFRRR